MTSPPVGFDENDYFHHGTFVAVRGNFSAPSGRGSPFHSLEVAIPVHVMAIEDAITLISAVTVSFGSGAVIVIGLSAYLGDLSAKRILQTELHELGLAKSSYDHYLDLILEYYQVFYRHYRMCQRAANADGYRLPDGTITSTQDEFFEALDDFLVDWAAKEGKIRLLLPSRILKLHVEAIDCFNVFKKSVEGFRKDDKTRQAKVEAFRELENVKSQLEDALREFLRTEKLLK